MPCSRELTNGHIPFAVKVSQLHGEERIIGNLPRLALYAVFFWEVKNATPINLEITMKRNYREEFVNDGLITKITQIFCH